MIKFDNIYHISEIRIIFTGSEISTRAKALRLEQNWFSWESNLTKVEEKKLSYQRSKGVAHLGVDRSSTFGAFLINLTTPNCTNLNFEM